MICFFGIFCVARGINTLPSAVPTPLTSQAQAPVPLFNPRGVQLEKEEASGPQGKCLFTPFLEELSFFHSAGIAGNCMITLAFVT